MLTLSPGSICNVCAEEYRPQCIPQSIPAVSSPLRHTMPTQFLILIQDMFYVHAVVMKLQKRHRHASSPSVLSVMNTSRVMMSISSALTSLRLAVEVASTRLLMWLTISLGNNDQTHLPLWCQGLLTRSQSCQNRRQKCSVEVSTLHQKLQDWLTHNETRSGLPVSTIFSLTAAYLMFYSLSTTGFDP